MAIAPPNYRHVNPMTDTLAMMAELATYTDPHTVNLVSGDPAFGSIAAAAVETLSVDFTSTGGWFLGVGRLNADLNKSPG